MSATGPLVLLIAELSCPGDRQVWHYIAPSDVDRDGVSRILTGLTDSENGAELLRSQILFIAPGQDLPPAGQWHPGPYSPLTTDPTFAQRARLAG